MPTATDPASVTLAPSLAPSAGTLPPAGNPSPSPAMTASPDAPAPAPAVMAPRGSPAPDPMMMPPVIAPAPGVPFVGDICLACSTSPSPYEFMPCFIATMQLHAHVLALECKQGSLFLF